MSEIIDGKKMAQEVRERLAKKIADSGINPVLAVIMAGNDEASRIYVKNKKKAAQEVGIEARIFELDGEVPQAVIEKLVSGLNEDAEVNGILVQLPLPKHIDSLKVLGMIDPLKDVDGFSPWNAGLLMQNSKDAVVAATPKGVLRMIKNVCPDLGGKNALVIGRSNIVGRPMAALLLNNDCTVTVAHSKTKNLAELAVQADIIVAACGRAKMVKKDWIKKGAIVIDVGINKEGGKLCGDVDFDEVKNFASHISPVPGGVGPMTIAMLLENTVEAWFKQKKK